MIRQAVILAGGRGERLKPFTDNNPKPLYPIKNRPFIYYLFDQLLDSGIEEIVLLLGYMASKIELVAIDYERNRNCHIICKITPEEYDTGARLNHAIDSLDDEFLLLYCDNYCPINIQKAYLQFRETDVKIQVTAYSNKDSYTRNNLKSDDGLITIYDKKRQAADLNAVDIGYAFIKRETIELMQSKNLNFEAEVYPKVVEQHKMGCYLTDHRYYSIGSWERMKLTEAFFRDRKVIFLDRDGTLNVRPPKAQYVTDPEYFVWIENAKEAIKYLKDEGYEIYLISNQPGIARGMMSTDQLYAVNEKMLKDLKSIGADIDGIYFCPHGWDEGCDCRKPKPGMLYQAQRDHSIDLTKSILIGDDERDIEAGEAAELMKCILVSEEYSLWDAVHDLG